LIRYRRRKWRQRTVKLAVPADGWRVLEHSYKKQSALCGCGRTLLCPDPSARGLAQFKTLARLSMALVNAKRLGLRWPSAAFPQDVTPQHFSENKIAI
jgi:hypothetical protein